MNDTLEEAFARREAAAFERAYEQFGARMYGTALRILRNEAAARDCVQDVLLHLWRRSNGYTPQRGSLEAFLVVCVRNAALATVRDSSRRQEITDALPRPPIAAVDPDPVAYEHVQRALCGLSPEHALVVELAYYRGLTHVEIASELREPLGTIKSRLSSALRSLRMVLQKEVNE